MTWHQGLIPENEIWVKLGGDKGGKTFKQMFQIANVTHPNAPRHTVVVCAFEASDNSYNLEVGLRHFKNQVVELVESKWR